MKAMNIPFRFSEPELAQALIKAKPPRGVRVSGSMQPIIRASAGADIVFNVSLEIKAHLNLIIVAAWVVRELLPHIKKRRIRMIRLNDVDLRLTESEVSRLIQDALHWQEVRDAQRKVGDEKKRLEDKKPPCLGMDCHETKTRRELD